jgi:hypothetical protein
MEIIYFIQVIRIMIGLFSTSTNTENMKGGGVGSMLKMGKRSMGSKGRNLNMAASMGSSMISKGASKQIGKFMSAQNKDSLKSSLKTMSGMTTASERVKSADGAIAIYKMIRFIVYMLSAFLVPFMPFYAATKSFFQKGIPFFKEVTVPESVDYEAKMLEKEINEQAQKK